MTDWPTVSLGRHVDLLTGYPFKSKQYTDHPDDILLISGYNIMQGYLRWDKVNRWPKLNSDGLEKYKLKVNDVVLAMDRPWIDAGLKYSWIKQENLPCLLVQRTARLRGSKTLDIKFLRYLIASPQFTSHVKGIITGSIVPHISSTDIKSFTFLLPPLPEQRRIAEILGTWDEAISLTERLIEAKQRRKTGLMQRLLTGSVRLPGFVKSEAKQETKYGEIPADWGLKPFKSLINPISRNEKVLTDKEYRLIGVRWYVEGAHIHNVLPGDQIITSTLSRIEQDDIVYNKMWASKSAFAIAHEKQHGAYGTTEYPQFRAKPNLLNIDFLEFVFHIPRFLYDAKMLCRGTTGRARLNPTDFLTIEIPLPSLPEQRAIAAVLQTADEEIGLLERKLAALRQQKQGLMQRLLTGEVRVNKP